MRTANRPSKYRGAPNKTSRGVKGCTKLRRASEEQARIANKHQEEPSKYIEDWMQKEPSEYIEDWMASASKGALAWTQVQRSRVQRVLTAPNIGVQSVTNGHRKGVLDMEYLRGTEVPQSADNWATR